MLRKAVNASVCTLPTYHQGSIWLSSVFFFNTYNLSLAMFVRASECTVSISQQVRDTKNWGFFILHVSRIKVFLEIHIDFQKCSEHHIFIPFQNNPYVSFWLQKSEHLPWEQDYFRQFIYVHTRIHKYEPFHMTLATPGSFLRTTISEADITCTLREFLFYESQPRFFAVQQMSCVCVVTHTHESQVSSAPTRKKSLHSQILLLSQHVWGKWTLQVC